MTNNNIEEKEPRGFIPIKPDKTETGAILSLIPLLGEKNSHPIPLSPSSSLSNFIIKYQDLAIDVAASLNIAGIFASNIDVHERGFYYDAIVYTDVMRTGGTGGEEILATRWGVGIRIVIRISNIKGNFDYNLATIGAAVEADFARATYEIQGIGLGQSGFEIVLDGLSDIASFNYQTYLDIHQKVIPKLSAYLKTNKNKFNPQPIAVIIKSSVGFNYLDIGQSVLFAMFQISKGKPLINAIESTPTDLNHVIIQQTYLKFIGDIPENDKPSEDAIKRAKQWFKKVKK